MRVSAAAAEPAPGRTLALLGTVIAVIVLSLLLGRYPQPGLTSPADLFHDEMARRLLLNLRLPRVLSAFLTGMALSGAGFCFQMVFRNPLVEPGFLGVSQGAAFGASLAIVVMGGSPPAIQISAGLFAVLGLAASTVVARRVRFGSWVLRLVLAGIAVSALFAAGTGLIKYLADPLDQLPDITFWLLGGLWAITWNDLLHILPVTVPCLLLLYAMRWRLNLLSLREETARSLGVSLGRERAALLLAAVLATAAVVAKAGLVGWVGLIVPHLARGLLGADAQRALPASLLLGGTFCLACDDLARTLHSGEIPLGIVTSLAGAGLFVVLMLRWRAGWRE